MKLIINPLYSELVNSGANSGLYRHQQQTHSALRDPNIDVIVNIAVTGDGKSRAVFEAFPNGGLLAMYPTNELALDQQRQLRDSPLRIWRISAESLEKESRLAQMGKWEMLLNLADADILLTNPDLFYYLHKGSYLKSYLSENSGQNNLNLWKTIVSRFSCLLFDEFHLYSAPQISGIFNTVSLLRSLNINHKLIFLSATPNPTLLDFLEKLNLIYVVIEGCYASIPQQGFRQISQEIELEIIPQEWAEDWILAHKKEILSFFVDNPSSKGAIILNSIASVKRVVKALMPLFEEQGLTVGENTGITESELANRAIKADLVVGTATLDIGIDFRINYLIFESNDADICLQRFGRLGRHEGFATYQAIAFMPRFVMERLEVNIPDSRINKLDFNRAIQQHHRQFNPFSQFYGYWSSIQGFTMGWQLNHQSLQVRYRANFHRYLEVIENLYQCEMEDIAKEIKKYRRWALEMGLEKGNPVVEVASSFRGLGLLDCTVFDPTSNHYFRYPLISFLRNFKGIFVKRDIFLKQHPDAPSFAHYTRFHFVYQDLRNRIIPISLYLNTSIFKSIPEKLQLIDGFSVTCEGYSFLEINRQLKTLCLVARPFYASVDEIRRRFNLPSYFPIFPLRDIDSHHGSPLYSITFDQSALLTQTIGVR